MKGAVEALHRELGTVRTGRASPSLVERLSVEYYGTATPLQNIAAIHATDARTLTIQPWDRKAIGDIEKAILKSDLGLNPTNDGQVLRLAIPPLTEERRKVVPRAAGVVLELGSGSGLNLGLYDPEKVVRVYGLEPDPAMIAKGRRRTAAAPVPVTVLEETAETLSLPDRSVDSVVVTFALCTIPDVRAALEGARRVLKPGGRLLFCEHGRSSEPDVVEMQTRWEPTWKRIFGGCHLTRDIPGLIRDAGFDIDDLEAGYMQAGRRPGGAISRMGGYLYRGSALAPG